MSKKYGCCPVCGYELTLENSRYTADFQDLESNEHSIREKLMKYHREASPDCKNETNMKNKRYQVKTEILSRKLSMPYFFNNTIEKWTFSDGSIRKMIVLRYRQFGLRADFYEYDQAPEWVLKYIKEVE